jgi:hypothetical protein
METMPMALIETIDSLHGGLLQALDEVEALLAPPATPDELTAAIEEARRELLAHELTAERFVVGPLRHLHLLDAEQLAALGDELDRLSREAIGLTCGRPDVAAVRVFVRRVRDHIERKARAVVPTARSALADGRLSAAPRWYVEEVYGLRGGPVARWPEKWLG